jgi:hypothetical protein
LRRLIVKSSIYFILLRLIFPLFILFLSMHVFHSNILNYLCLPQGAYSDASKYFLFATIVLSTLYLSSLCYLLGKPPRQPSKPKNGGQVRKESGVLWNSPPLQCI